MKIKVVKEIECCRDCPFYIDELSCSPYCSHPFVVGDMGLSHNGLVGNQICASGFPEKCPLLKGKILKKYNKEKKRVSKLKTKLIKLWKTK